MKASLALVLFANVMLSHSTQKYVSTPIGQRPSQCVHFTEEENAIVTVKDGYTVVYYPDSKRSVKYPALPECVSDAQRIMASRKVAESKGDNSRHNLKDWVDYAYATVPDMGVFTATYGLPDQDPTDGGELLYYFIGLQNDDDADVTIIQPVIVYCGNCGQWDQGWSMVPWNCCPNGQSWYGANYSVPAGASISAYILANDSTVVVSSTYESQTSTLVVSDRKRTFDWAAATLEEYSVTTCDLYPSLPFNVTDMVLTDSSGKSVSPRWDTTGQERCDGGAKVIDEQTVLIYGRDLPGPGDDEQDEHE